MKDSTFCLEELKTKITLMHFLAFTGVFFIRQSVLCDYIIFSEHLNIRICV